MKLLRTESDMMEAVRDRIRDLAITHETVDHISGLPSGYTSKLMAGMKGIGPKSWPLLAGALGLALRITEDPEQVARVQGRWVKRKRAIDKKKQFEISASTSASTKTEVAITPELQRKMGLREHMKKIASSGGKRRAKMMGKRARQRAASHAARMRWARRNAP